MIFLRILTIATNAIRYGLDYYQRQKGADQKLVADVAYCVACLDAAIARKPMPKIQ